MRFRLEIDCGGPAFAADPSEEIRRILRSVADRVIALPCPTARGAHDAAGNQCCMFALYRSDDELRALGVSWEG
jgi:hypothetical protein